MPLMRLLGIEKRIETALIILDDFERRHQALFGARFAELQQRLFRARENVARLFLGQQRPVHQVLRRHGDAAQRRFIAHDPDVAVQVRDVRQPVVERNQVTQPVHRFQLVVTHQLVRYRDAVDLLAALMQFRHPHENAAVLLDGEIVQPDHARDLDETRIVEHDRTEDESLGIDVGGKSFV